ncbi:MAG: cohesin domain-containing protein [Candidatus Neomarinimicrobiota bacterium]|nr:cohesin domain-containing protein [Candidatus Neomarinimicrobiota bacterium]
MIVACGESPDLSNTILDSDIGENTPETTINLDSNVFNSSSVTLTWSGEFVNAFRYKLEPIGQSDTVKTYLDWSSWGRDTTSVTLNHLDEGNYNFHVEGRFNMDYVGSASVSFEVDAISGESLRMFPLQQYVKIDDAFNVYLYSEEIDDLTGMQVQLNYDVDVFEYQGWEKGSDIVDYADLTIIPDLDLTEGGILFTGVVSGNGLPSTSELLKLTFKYLGDVEGASSGISIDLTGCENGNECNTQLRDNLNQPIQIMSGTEGLVKEVQ